MFRNYLTVALRNIAKHRLYSFINIAGLAVGLASAILILLLVRDELSYDTWIPNSENIYRAEITFKVPGRDAITLAPAMFPLGPALKAEIPQVQAAVRIGSQQSAVRYGDKNFFEDVQVADPDFFQVVQLPLVKGDPATVLQNPESAVISESLAHKYFGDEDPIGKVVQLDAGSTVQITGVMRDLPTNTHLDVGFVIPIASKSARNAVEELKRPHWTNANWYTYVRVAPGTDPKVLTNGMTALFRKNLNPKDFGFSQDVSELLMPSVIRFQDIHLGSNLQGEMKPNSDWTTVYGFAAIAGLILLIACINFMNLATARAMQRSREVSMRKVVGAARRQLIVQFLGESVLLSLLALVLGLALVEIVLPYFGQFLDRDLSLNYFTDWDVSLGVARARGARRHPRRPLSRLHHLRLPPGAWCSRPIAPASRGPAGCRSGSRHHAVRDFDRSRHRHRCRLRPDDLRPQSRTRVLARQHADPHRHRPRPGPADAGIVARRPRIQSQRRRRDRLERRAVQRKREQHPAHLAREPGRLHPHSQSHCRARFLRRLSGAAVGGALSRPGTRRRHDRRQGER